MSLTFEACFLPLVRTRAKHNLQRRTAVHLQASLLRYQLRYQTSPEAGKNKGLPKKAFEINNVFWLLDLGSNQGPTD